MFLVAAASLLFSAVAGAQSAGQGFLFQQPSGSITLNAGYAGASASSDLFSFVTDQLTLNKRDFSGPTLGLDVAVRFAPRFDAVVSTSYSGTSTPSHYREFIDQNDAEITQTTEFKRVPLMLSVRAYLAQRGQSVGRFAWVPSRFAPYVGIGGGTVWYKFRQYGDFVDYNDNNSVFTSDLSSTGWAPAAQGLAGIDFTISPHVALNGEARYLWAKGSLDQSFSGFDKIDLSGLSATVGLTYRY
jgi:opacity protein-like surface antigen